MSSVRNASHFRPLLPVDIQIPPIGIDVAGVHAQILEYLNSRTEKATELGNFIRDHISEYTLGEQMRLQSLYEDVRDQTTMLFYISNSVSVVDAYTRHVIKRQDTQEWRDKTESLISQYFDIVRDYIEPELRETLIQKSREFTGLVLTQVNSQESVNDPVHSAIEYAKKFDDSDVSFVKNTVRHPHNLRSLAQFFYTLETNHLEQKKKKHKRRGTHHDVKITQVCPSCNKQDFVEDGGKYICIECCIEVGDTGGGSTFGDVDRVQMTTRYKYDPVDHFKDEMIRYEGKQTTKIPPEVFDRIVSIARGLNLIRDDAETEEEKYRDFTKFSIYQIMRAYEMSAYYHDINRIRWQITGIPPPNISHVRKTLVAAHIKILKVYDQIKPPEWKNFIQGQYTLCQLLIAAGEEVDHDDILLLRTWEKVREHDAVGHAIFQELGWSEQFVALSSY